MALAALMRPRNGAIGVAHGDRDPRHRALTGSAEQPAHHATSPRLALKFARLRIDAEAHRPAIADENDALASGALASCGSFRPIRDPPAQIERWSCGGYRRITASMTGPPGHASLLQMCCAGISLSCWHETHVSQT